MLFHLPKLPAEIRITHLNARINEQRKQIAQTSASKLELLQLTQLKSRVIVKRPIKKFIF